MPKKKVMVNEEIKTIEQIHAQDAKERFAIANTYHEAGYTDKIFYSPANGAVLGGSDAYSRNQLVHNNLCHKRPDTVRFKINQLMRFQNPADGKEFLRVQYTIEARDAANKVRSFAVDAGIYQRPVMGEVITGYSQEDGGPIGTRTELTNFEDFYSIPFSAEQLKALQPHFDKHVSLLIKTASGRKYTCESLEQLMADFEAASARLIPKVKRSDGSE